MRARLAEGIARVRPWLQGRKPWLLLLLLIAVAYYGSYFRCSYNFRDEGGTVALVGKRLLDGERPFLDVTLNYNVLWFYPVVGLFKLFGPNFALLRAYCFALSTLTAVLAFLVVERASRRAWAAFLVALLAVLVPGMTFKNYMPLMAVGNAFCLLQFALGPRRHEEATAAEAAVSAEAKTAWPWLAIGGLALGFTFLIRVDVGFFFLLLWLGVIVLCALRGGQRWAGRFSLLIGGPLLIVALATAVHLPFYADAVKRGFAGDFIEQYTGWPATMQQALVLRVYNALVSPPPALPAPAAVGPPAEKETSWNTENLTRPPLSQAWRAQSESDRLLALLIYAPFFSLLPLGLWALCATLRGLWERRPGGSERPTAALAIMGAAMTTFPQYFFFRPDSPHVSEFSPGFWVAAFGACFLLGFAPAPRRNWRHLVGSLLLALLTLHAGVFLYRMLPDRWTGTIWAMKNRTYFFRGENGVNVYVSKREAEGLRKLLEAVRAHSAKGDYLVAYPYHPAINVMCDRRTYERNVYIDNATRPVTWNDDAIQRFQKYRPAVIVLSDWAINDTEDSRFSNWARPAKTWIQSNYNNQGKIMDFEIFTRPEREQ